MKKPFPISDLFSLRGRVVVLTGAGGQLGKQLARALFDAGAHIVLADLRLRDAEKVSRALRRKGQKILSVEMDTTSRHSIKVACDLIQKTFGRVDILINNAGVAVHTPFAKRTEAEYDHVMGVNLRGTLFCSQIFSSLMKLRRHGVIINIGSVYGVVSADPRIYGRSGRNSSEVYAASKAGVIHMTRYLAVHLAPHRIRVNCISPGGVFNHQDPAFVKKYALKTPLGRMATDQDLNGALIYLASDASTYVTGHNLIVDGGFSIW